MVVCPCMQYRILMPSIVSLLINILRFSEPLPIHLTFSLFPSSLSHYACSLWLQYGCCVVLPWDENQSHFCMGLGTPSCKIFVVQTVDFVFPAFSMPLQICILSPITIIVLTQRLQHLVSNSFNQMRWIWDLKKKEMLFICVWVPHFV